MLVSILGAPLAAHVLTGCEDDRDVAPHAEGEILGPSMERGHRLRDGDLPTTGAWERAPVRRVGVAILGGGAAGLSAAWRLARRGVGDFEVLELEAAPGGTSMAGESAVTPYPWGAHYVPVPMAHDTDLIALFAEMRVLDGTDANGHPRGAEESVVRVPEERLFYDGFWYEGLYPYAGASAGDLAELHRFRDEIDRLASLRDGSGRRAFAIPIAAGSDDADLIALDRIDAAQWLAREGYRSPRLRWLLEYGCRDDYGLELTETSAWAALWYYAARTPARGRARTEPRDGIGDRHGAIDRAGERDDAQLRHTDTMPLLAWPEGNGAIVRHLARAAGRRVRTGQLVADVEARENDVVVRVIDAETDRPATIVADRAVVALPRFVAARVVRSLRDRGDEGFRYGAWAVANLHLDGRPGSNGYPLSWDNVLHDSPSLGYVCATHQRGRDFGPTVFTYYLPMTDADAAAGRRRLLEPTWEGFREAIVRDLSRAHPDLASRLARLDVWRWGHGMIQPRVGFVWSEARRRAADPIGRVHFAHSDLSGIAIFEEAFFHGVRAADEIVAARRDGAAVQPEGDVAT